MGKYSCPECNKTFTNRSSRSLCLRKHNNKELYFKCPKCPKAYKDPGSLRKHKRVYNHKNLPDDNDIEKDDNLVSNNCPMNLSLQRISSQTLPSIDTFSFSNSNNSKVISSEHAIDLTSRYRQKLIINQRIKQKPNISVNNAIQYPVNLTIQSQNVENLSKLPIDLSFHNDSNSDIQNNHSEMMFANQILESEILDFDSSTSCISYLPSNSPLDLSFDQHFQNNHHPGSFGKQAISLQYAYL